MIGVGIYYYQFGAAEDMYSIINMQHMLCFCCSYWHYICHATCPSKLIVLLISGRVMKDYTSTLLFMSCFFSSECPSISQENISLEKKFFIVKTSYSDTGLTLYPHDIFLHLKQTQPNKYLTRLNITF